MTATEFTGDGLRIIAQDLSNLSPTSDDNDRLYHHNGASTITLDGGSTTSDRGYYVWDSSAGVWSPVFNNADKLDGRDAGDFLLRDGSMAMLGNLDLGTNGLINITSASGATGELHLNTNHVELHSHTAGANLRLYDSNSLLLLETIEGGNVNAPNGELQEQGNRVATRNWTNANADVPNADYADNAGLLGGQDSTAFLSVAGDQMEGSLDMGGFNLNDGGTTIYDATNGYIAQTALQNDAITVNAGTGISSAGTAALGGSLTVSVDDSRYVQTAGDTMSGALNIGGNSLFSTSTITGAAVDEARIDFGFDPNDILLQTPDGTGGYTSGIIVRNSGASANVEVPNGALTEQGNRVATRSWTDANYDIGYAPVSIPVTKWANGLSDEEIWRTSLEAGEKLEVHRLDLQLKGGGSVSSPSNFKIVMYDVTNNTVIGSSFADGTANTGNPIATSGDGATVVMRLSNVTGSYKNASISGELRIV